MSVSTEAQNQIQSSLDNLFEVAKTDEERVEAIYMAWDGYIPEPQTLWVDVILVLIGLAALFWNEVVGFIILAIGAYWIYSEIKAKDIRQKHKRTQQLAGDFLRVSHPVWRKEGMRRFESGMDQAAGAVQTLWKRIVYWPSPNAIFVLDGASFSAKFTGRLSGFRLDDPNNIKPVFSGDKEINMMGYLATASSLMVFPAGAANIKNISLWQSLRDRSPSSVPIALDQFRTSVRSAKDGECNPAVLISGLDNLSCAELYFSDMVTAEYSASEGQIGELKVTTRDGRSFELRANPEVGNLVREAIRVSKGVAQGVRLTPSFTLE